MRIGIALEDGTYGRRAVLTSAWADYFLPYLMRHEVVELELNYAKGWQGTSLSFLTEMPDLKAFEIFHFNIRDISEIHGLRRLRRLGVTTYCSTAIDFSAFPELESCSLEWRPKATSLFECTTLKELFVNRYKGKDVAGFAKLVNLESLAILSAPLASLQGLSALTKLRSLRLALLRRLPSLAGIEGLANLEELDISTCRLLRSIDEVGALSRLRKLFFANCGDIESLKPLQRLDRLEWLGFYETTNIVDGDLSPLLGLRNLSRLAFQNRRHYSHRMEDFDANEK